MSKLSIGDIVSLAKAGYSVADVKELITMSSEAPEGKEAPEAPEAPEEKEAPEILALKNQIAEMQKQNVHQNINENNVKTDEDVINDLLRDLIS